MRLALVGTVARLDVPAGFASTLAASVQAGVDQATAWSRANPGASADRFDHDAVLQGGAPPTGADAAADLDAVRAAKLTRTPDGIAAAQWYQRFGGWDIWKTVVAEIGASEGADQARRAQRLVDAAQDRVDVVTTQLKETYDRPRPYQVDPEIDPVVHRPDGNASFPSGHASGAYAAAIVLAALVPERAQELLDMASQVAYSRVYGGVHFPTDVMAGARLAARVASDVLRRDAAANATVAA
jgi:acid phosphatase (class A)